MRGLLICCFAVIGLASGALAQPADGKLPFSQDELLLLAAEQIPFISTAKTGPMSYPRSEGALPLEPTWTSLGLLAAPPSSKVPALSEGLSAGVWQQDQASGSWFTWAAGTVARWDDGRLVVVAQNVQSSDFHISTKAGYVASRESGDEDRIVLHSLADTGRSRRVVLTATHLFAPRFSPDGTMLLVQRSGGVNDGFDIVSLESGNVLHRSAGYWASWAGGSKSLVFAEITSDGYRVKDSTLKVLKLENGRQYFLPVSGHYVPMYPVFSPDGKMLAFVDARTGGVVVMDAPGLGAEVRP